MGTAQDQNRPDYTLVNSDIQATDEPPRVHAVTDLRAFLKPALDEELGGPSQGQDAPVYRTVCTCVPVMECVCDTVTVIGCPCTVTCPSHTWPCTTDIPPCSITCACVCVPIVIPCR